MTQEIAKDKTKEETQGISPEFLTHFVVYVIAVTVMYFVWTPEVTGNFTEREERGFHVAAVSLTKGTKDASYVPFTLAYLKTGKVDLSSVSFLLPQGDIKINIPGAELHKVTVLERHPDWQLVEYRYVNTNNSTSRYRAFKDRIEPVSYRITMGMALVFNLIALLIPAVIVSALINAIWKSVARRRKMSDVA